MSEKDYLWVCIGGLMALHGAHWFPQTAWLFCAVVIWRHRERRANRERERINT